MPRRSSFYASPRGLAVCMTLTWVSKKRGYWLNCVCISAFCGSERIGTSDGSLERRKKSGRLQNGLNLHWNSRANVHTYTHSVSLGSLVHTVRYSRVFPSLEIFSIYSTLRAPELMWCDQYICYFLQRGRLHLTSTFSEASPVVSGVIIERVWHLEK